MNRNKLKVYAPQARRDFINAVTDRAAFYGLTKEKIDPINEQGDVAIIGGKPFPIEVAKKRTWLVERIRREGFEQVMEAIAYTWFNRFAAIRFMEIHGYLDHGYRVLSHPEGYTIPEIVEHAEHINLPGLDKEKAVELKLEGTKETQLYRMLLMGQCNALHKAMPFLFEKIGDATELLLPENLLHSDSLIRRMVNEIPEEEWEEVEIIGWLYQFYISEKKDQVIGKVVKSEDIPAATQLFTPNWIVKYMVQNSLGAQWLATYPHSPLKKLMEYYIEPADQTPEVEEQLKAITPDTLNPEELTLADVACGSGHILVEGYDLFKAIYQERGYRAKDIPRLILEKNLYGLDIDERAAQLTGFALMMKGRADDRRLFERGVKLNVMALVDSAGFDAEGVANGVKLADYGLKLADLTKLKRLFEHATIFGSLIQVPEGLSEKLLALKKLSEATSPDLFVSEALKRLGPLVRQAELLVAQYDAVVANPPYMGSKAYCPSLKKFVNDIYEAGKADLYGAFTLRNIYFVKKYGRVGMITIPNWMFLTSFEKMRNVIFTTAPISSLVHNGRGVWGSDFGSCAYILERSSPDRLSGRFLRLFDRQGSVSSNDELVHRFHANTRFSIPNSDFKKIAGSPVAYWASQSVIEIFDRSILLGELYGAKSGVMTGDDVYFLKSWYEVNFSSIGFNYNSESKIRSNHTFFPMNKEEGFRKWTCRGAVVFRYFNHGAEHAARDDLNYRLRDKNLYFKSGISWSDITIGALSFRYQRPGLIFAARAPTLFCNNKSLLAFLNSKLTNYFCGLINPTVSFNLIDLYHLPLLQTEIESKQSSIEAVTEELISISDDDWNTCERSWDFQSLPLLTASSDPTPTLESSYTAWITQNRKTIAEMKRLEGENNHLFIDVYGLTDELTPDVPLSQITLTVNPAYRYGGKLTEEEQWTRFRQDTMEELVSYAIGCMMGRYSLDAPGLIYAHSGNEGFDSSRYPTFPADADGIVPLTDTEWFDDDVCHRLIEFISVAWDASHLEDNLTFLADNLAPKKGEVSRETIRRYLCDKFFKEHLKTYKKRPIYWLFSSGKFRAFQCLVYLHRYNEGTLARMRTEYVIPLQGKIAARIDQLTGDINAANSTARRKKLERERDKLIKQQGELQSFDEKLRHYADQRISLDLDDGVKINYGKFGDLLAEVKAVTGKR